MELKRKMDFRNSGNRYILKYTLFLSVLFIGVGLRAQVVSISVDTNTAQETSVGPTAPVTFTVSKSATPVSNGRTVTYEVVGQTTNGDDHTFLSGFVTLPAGGATSDEIVVDIFDDDLVEARENLTIRLLNGSGYSVDQFASEATVAIEDNDVGTLTVDTVDADAEEENSDQGRFVIRLDKENQTGATVSVAYTLSGTATNGGAQSDYTTTGQATLTFPAGQFSRAINIIPEDDTVAESDETVILTLQSVSSPQFLLGTPNSGTVTIADNDCSAGSAPPTINDNETDFCDVAQVNLDGFVDEVTPVASSLRWSLIADPTTVGDLLASPNVNQGNTYYAVYYSASGACFSPTSPVTITLAETENIGTVNPGIFSCNTTDFGGTTTLNLDTTLSGAAPGGVWTFVTGPENPGNINGNNVVNFDDDDDGTYIFRYTLTNDPCPEQTIEVSVPVSNCEPCDAGNAAPALDDDVPLIFCDVIDISLNDYTDSAPPPGTVLRWSTSRPDEDDIPPPIPDTEVEAPNAGTYFGYFYDAANECASPALRVQLTRNTTPEVEETSGDQRCGTGSVTLTISATGNPTYNWYTSPTSDTPIANGSVFTPNLSQTTIYYVEATENNCATPRIPVTATIIAQPSAGTATDASACSIAANGRFSIDLDDQLVGEDEGVWTITDDPSSGALQLSNENVVDFQGLADGTYVFTFTTTGAQAPCTNESVAVSISVNDCDIDTDLDGLFDGPEASLGTDPNNRDTDGDGIDDGEEVGDDLNNPLDEDGDSIIDALESTLTDADSDGVPDQSDPANNNPCIPNNNNGLCDTDEDGIVDGEEITNGTDPNDACDPDPENENCNREIDLEIVKTIDNEDATIGDTVVFRITVTNLSDIRARGIQVAEVLEGGFQYVSHEASLGTYDPELGQWDIFEIEPVADALLEITVTIVTGSSYNNTAELLRSVPNDGNPDNDSATVSLAIERPEGINLVLEKSARIKGASLAAQANPLVGEEVEFVLKVTNASANNSVGNIRVSDVLTNIDEIQFEFEGFEAAEGSSYDPATGIWRISEELSVGEDITLVLLYRCLEAGLVSNTATITASSPAESEGQEGDNEASATVNISERTPLDVGILYNQFSPNGDGVNDDLKINQRCFDAPDTADCNEPITLLYSIEIFNRYGRPVFMVQDQTTEEIWDGTWKGEQVPDGTYYYVLEVQVNGGGPEIKKGWIQLIR
ncbi:gliding motility-associated C-terminal domain-containing protein [Maribacter sp. 2-571]|uniref:T9SS type B sorting domain-containing protein n=1 Tax=Maribacter sp. 2-571 TaxID=3417569 RepID=UPI003D340836